MDNCRIWSGCCNFRTVGSVESSVQRTWEMIDVLNFIADHWFGTLVFGYLLFLGIESLIETWKGK
ncbi:NADH-ubiquinone oxidoreductase chain 3 [Escherichia phage ZCEC13]|uniref:NADH-ubiquinone oxidoreductase chain 3 n=1 Tax=Escherichia phage ZCEC13 TaxID=2935866 RepID=A0AAE9HK61_9CAUD|nr:NADH-ubiquinone oxidoreductase chain 3 [Escherichia phage ZCEC13]